MKICGSKVPAEGIKRTFMEREAGADGPPATSSGLISSTSTTTISSATTYSSTWSSTSTSTSTFSASLPIHSAIARGEEENNRPCLVGRSKRPSLDKKEVDEISGQKKKKKEIVEVILAQDQLLDPGHVEARCKVLEGALSLSINTTRPRLDKDQVDRGDVREKKVQKILTKNRESEEIILLQDRRRLGHLEARFKALEGMSQVIDEVKALEEENRDVKDLNKMREEEIEEIKLLWNQRCLRNFKAMSKSLDQLRNTPKEVGSARQYQAGNVAEDVVVISSDEDDETQQAHQESKTRERNEQAKCLEEEISALSLDLECPVCLIVCAPPIYSCLAQHPVCSECRKDLKQCVVCREPYDHGMIRHRYAERDYEKLEKKRFEKSSLLKE